MVAMPNADEDVQKLNHSSIAGGNVKWPSGTAILENNLAISFKTLII